MSSDYDTCNRCDEWGPCATHEPEAVRRYAELRARLRERAKETTMSVHDERRTEPNECPQGYAGCNCTHRPDFENCPNCGDPPAERPDDVVERCAQAQAYPQYHTDWNCLRDGQKNFLRNQARAVLDAIAKERGYL